MSSSGQPRPSNRGQKRKRKDFESDTPELRKLGTKLHHSVKDVKKAAKKAKTFETQKIVKKLKQLRNEAASSEATRQLEAELETLKTLDVDRIALISLSAKIHKDREISTNSDAMGVVQAHLGSHMSHRVDHTVTGKVESRLFSSKYLAVENAKVVQSLIAVLGSQTGDKNGARSANLPCSEDDEAIPDDEDIASKQTSHYPAGPSAPLRDETIKDSKGVPDESADDGWESEPLGEGDDASTPGEEDSSEEVTRPSVNKKSKPMPVNSSTFLPSLAVGFTRGDSDGSDWDDTEEVTAPARKNRRGQRARKAIWEKKYGANANHVKKQREEGSRNGGRPPNKRTGWNANGSKTGLPHLPRSRPQRDSLAPQTTTMQSEKGSDATQDIHPSWAAKRRLKEKESASIVPAQGKKITFA